MNKLRNKKTKIGIILTGGMVVVNMFIPDMWVDISIVCSVCITALGWNDKKEREMKWKRVDKK